MCDDQQGALFFQRLVTLQIVKVDEMPLINRTEFTVNSRRQCCAIYLVLTSTPIGSYPGDDMVINPQQVFLR